jgi:diaminohydroxyphosphoribosylaminopyrimidine deaminase/5-amino-6-(5-phosphoribosylamino)uracil reductase
MQRAMELAAGVRSFTSPNPWVGAVVVDAAGNLAGEGATAPVGGPHAEVTALARAGNAARGGTVYVTLEPCAHTGLTPPCTDALTAAGARRVVVGVKDPDPKVAGRGVATLAAAGIEVEFTNDPEVGAQLAPYLKHRRTGRPFVVVKLAMTLDGRTAAPDGTSKWITGSEARADVATLRAESDAILVGARTVELDDPQLTARVDLAAARRPDGWDDTAGPWPPPARQPLRVVLGKIPPEARAHPALEMSGDLDVVLDDLGARGVLQLLVEGGARTAQQFHAAGLVDRYVIYIAPALLGGSDGRPVLDGEGAATMADAWRGRLVEVTRLGSDVKVVVDPADTKEQVG